MKILITTFIISIFYHIVCTAQQEIKLKDGRIIILNTNGTWINKPMTNLSEEIKMPDGETLIINQDGTWKIKIEPPQYSEIKDARDGKTYKTVKIGGRWWLAENLNFTTEKGSLCYSNSVDNCKTFGRLYTWEAAKKACPVDWHLPGDEEWQKLEYSIGMAQAELAATGYRGAKENIGGKLKSTSNWNQSNSGATNESGFNAFPAGYCDPSGLFQGAGNSARYWTISEENEEFAWARHLLFDDNEVRRLSYSKLNAYSVRCVKNQ